MELLPLCLLECSNVLGVPSNLLEVETERIMGVDHRGKRQWYYWLWSSVLMV